jgi:CheY-like chemotaxis protein
VSAKPILIVEDDGPIPESLQELLEGEGYAVKIAANGKEALESIRELGGRCLVLLDLQMPVMSGEDSLAREPDPAVRAVDALVLTARVEGLLRTGVRGIIRKPIDLEDLLGTIARHCG